MSEREETEEIRDLRAWMRAVMDERQWSAGGWATRAEVAPSTVTRFLKDGYPVPATATIAKLSRVAGSVPTLGRPFMPVPPDVRLVPVLDRAQLLALSRSKKLTAKEPHDRTTATALHVSSQAFAAQVDARTMESRGIMPGDILVLEPLSERKPQNGDVILYAVKQSEDLRVGEFQKPWIVHNTTAGDPPVAVKEAGIIGVAVEVRRELSRVADAG